MFGQLFNYITILMSFAGTKFTPKFSLAQFADLQKEKQKLILNSISGWGQELQYVW